MYSLVLSTLLVSVVIAYSRATTTISTNKNWCICFNCCIALHLSLYLLSLSVCLSVRPSTRLIILYASAILFVFIVLFFGDLVHGHLLLFCSVRCKCFLGFPFVHFPLAFSESVFSTLSLPAIVFNDLFPTYPW